MTLTEPEITGAIARKLREDAGMTQAAFWRPLGVQQSVACRYEQGADMPKAVRILLVARYIGGMRIDAETTEGVAEIQRLAAIQSKHAEAKRAAHAARTSITSAAKHLQQAADALQTV